MDNTKFTLEFSTFAYEILISTIYEEERYEPVGMPRLTATYLLVAHVTVDEELVRCLADDGRPVLLK